MAQGCCGASALRFDDGGPLEGLLVGGWPGAAAAVEPAPRAACCAACAGAPERAAGVVMPVTFSTGFRRSTAEDLQGMSDLELYERMTNLQEMDFAASTAPAVIAEYRAELTAVRQEMTRREVGDPAPPPEPESPAPGSDGGGGGGSGLREEDPPPPSGRGAAGPSGDSGGGLLLVGGLVALALVWK